MSLRQDCAEKDCGHDVSSHLPEVESSGDLQQTRRTIRTVCQVAFCTCRRFKEPKR